MTLDHAQRWGEGETRWVPRRHVVDTRKLEVALIGEADAKDFVLAHHYSGSYPAARLRAGLFMAGQLVGVAVFSEPANPATIPAWTNKVYSRAQGVELGRFVLLDHVGFNAESFFWARARRLLRVHKPDVRVLISYSDPVRREALTGEVVMPGHVGTIYQATNAAYQGRASSRTLYLDPAGKAVSPRALSKIIAGAKGQRYARALLEEATGTRQRVSESAREWVERARGHLRKLRHPGNHVYLWGLTRRDRVPKGLTPPRQVDPVQLGLL